MATKRIKTTFLLRRGTALEWRQKNPILNKGEPGYETDTGLLKIGSGKSDWKSLPYFVTEDTPLYVDGNEIGYTLKDIFDALAGAEDNAVLTKSTGGFTWIDLADLLENDENFHAATESLINNKIDDKAAIVHFMGRADPVYEDPEDTESAIVYLSEFDETEFESGEAPSADPINGELYPSEDPQYIYLGGWYKLITNPSPGDVYLVQDTEYVYDNELGQWIPLSDSAYNHADLVTADELKNYLTVNELTLDKIKQKDEDHDYVIWNCGNALSNNFIDMTTDERVPRVGTLETDNENAPLLY